MRSGDSAEFFGGFRKRDVEAALTGACTVEQELERERRLARARRAFQQIEPLLRQPAAEDVIQSLNTARDALGRRGCRSHSFTERYCHTAITAMPTETLFQFGLPG